MFEISNASAIGVQYLFGGGAYIIFGLTTSDTGVVLIPAAAIIRGRNTLLIF